MSYSNQVLYICDRIVKIWLLPLVVFISGCGEDMMPDEPMTIDVFLQTCPLDDAVGQEILSDFEFLIDNNLVNDFSCGPDYQSVSFEELTDPLVYLQTIRTIRWIDELNSGMVTPFTNLSLYNWLIARVDGVNFSTGRSGGGSCCFRYNSKLYIDIGAQDQSNKIRDLNAVGILSNIAFLLHERRHADPSIYHHSSCCAAGERACDDSYDLNDVGSYGITLWFYESILKGEIDVGLGCLSESRKKQITDFLFDASSRLHQIRFCIFPEGQIKAHEISVSRCLF